MEISRPGNATITVTTKDGKYTAKAEISVIEAENSIETSVNNVGTSSNNKEQVSTGNQNSNKIEKPSNNEEQNNPPQNENISVGVTGVVLNLTSLTLTEGESAKLTATVNPNNANNKGVIWASSNSDIVSVDTNGNIKALKPGSATITVTTKDGGYTASAQISVNRKVINVTGVVLNLTSLNLTEGESTRLTATVNPSNADNKNVAWISSNPDIVSVDANGNVKALKPGSATITVTTNEGNYKATCQVTVKAKTSNYNVIFTPIVQDGTGAVAQYSVVVTKNNSSFNDCKFIKYNGTIVKKTLSSIMYNKNITSATIRLNDGSEVTAEVLYK